MDDKPLNSKVGQEPVHYGQIVLQQMVTKKWSDIVVSEQAESDFLLFAENLYRRQKDGSWKTIPCNLHPLRGHEKRRARAAARDMAAREKVDQKLDPDLFEDIDTLCILHLAIRSTTAPFEPLYGSPEELERAFDRDTLGHIFGVLDDYTKLLDPRLEVLDESQFMTLVAAIVEGRSIRPLRAFGGSAQHSSIVTMAELLMNFLTARPSPASSAPSTPEPSPPTNSLQDSEAPT